MTYQAKKLLDINAANNLRELTSSELDNVGGGAGAPPPIVGKVQNELAAGITVGTDTLGGAETGAEGLITATFGVVE